MPNYYFDLLAARTALEKGQTPFTPNVNMIVALREALQLLHAEGLEAVYQRHKNLARMTRSGIEGLGLTLFANCQHASAVVTSVRAPQGVDSTRLVQTVAEQHNILISGGQGELKGKIFRIGHLGWVGPSHVYKTIAAVAAGLNQLGYHCDAGSALAIARTVASRR